MNLFNFDSYKEFIKHYFKSLPKNGHGEAIKIAKNIGISTTLVSQILNGNVDFTIEQAIRYTQFLSFNDRESDYFVQLVLLSRAGDPAAKSFFKKRIEKMKAQENSVKNRLNLESNLNANDQALYYSEWYHAAIWLLVSIPEFRNRSSIATYLQLHPQRINDSIENLIRLGLIKESNGQLEFISKNIHVASDSPLVYRHHTNWRWVAVKKMESSFHAANLHFTSPVVLTKVDAFKVREILLNALEKSNSVIVPSECQELFCLNVDWFKV